MGLAGLVSILTWITAWSSEWAGPFLGLISAVLAGLKKFSDEARPHLDTLRARYPEKPPEPDPPAADEPDDEPEDPPEVPADA